MEKIKCKRCGKTANRDETWLDKDGDQLICTQCGARVAFANNDDYQRRDS